MKTLLLRIAHLGSNKQFRTAALIGLLVCTSVIANAQSPTAPALGFNIFLQNGAKLVSNETEGAVALGGDLTLAGNYRVAIKNSGFFKVGNVAIGLVIGGKVIFSSGNQTYVNNGYLKIGVGTGTKVWYQDNNGANSNLRVTSGNYDAQPSLNLQTSASNLGVSATNNPVIEGGLIKFATAFDTLKASATNMAKYATNIEFTNPNGDKKSSKISDVLTGGQVKVNLKAGTNVMNLTGDELNSVTNGITFNNGPDASRVLVINVNAAGNFTWKVWNQAGLSLQHCPFIIYNFYNTTALNIEGNNTIEGTVFAPFADITKTVNQSNIEGQVIGQSFHQSGGEVHFANFTPQLPNTNVPAVSLPTTGATTPEYANKAITSVKLSWTNGNGAGRIVIAQKGSEAGAPVNNQVYTANAKFGDGTPVGAGYVVYNGTGNSVTITNLEAGASYYFTIIEYNAEGSVIAYNTTQKLVSNTQTLADTDGDGVADPDDNFPKDATKAFQTSFPAGGLGTLMYEDKWPAKGDYDFNDLVIDYRFTTVTNAAGNVVQVEYKFVPKAVGASFRNAFAFQLDGISPDKVASVTGTKMTAGWSKLNPNGTEASQPNHANIIVFDDAVQTFNGVPAGTSMVNTYINASRYNADTIFVVVKFQPNAVSLANLPTSKFNPYLIVNQVRGMEIHLADRLPSAKADPKYYGSQEDNTNPGSGRYYKTKNNLPWALNISYCIPHAQETKEFSSVYLNFVKWAESGGTTHTNWYLDVPGNCDNSKLYKK